MWNTSIPTSPYPLGESELAAAGVFVVVAFVANIVEGRYP
jgi:hypothetical protein